MQETLFILEKAQLLGVQAGDVYQVIDTKKGTLQNVITFDPKGGFTVDSTLQWVAVGARTNFRFTSAKLTLPGGANIRLPPFGSGWFESVYVDSKYRLSKDVRGDYLLVEKQGPPRRFN